MLSLSAETESAPRSLHSIAEVQTLTPTELQQGWPVEIRGEVTYYKPGKFPDLMIMDEQGAGIYVYVSGPAPILERRQVVQVKGITHRGRFAPALVASDIRVIGAGDYPSAKPVVLAGSHTLQDGSFVQLSGVVRSAKEDRIIDPPRLLIQLSTAGGLVPLWVLQYQPSDLTAFIDTEIIAEGVVHHLGTVRHQPGTVRLLVTSSQDITVIAQGEDPYSLPATPLEELWTYVPGGYRDHRLHLRGTVSYHIPGEVLYLTDERAAVRVLTSDTTPLQLGDIVDVVGFATVGRYLVHIEDGSFRVRSTGPPPKPINEPFTGKMGLSHFECALVTMEAVVRDRFRTEQAQELSLEADGRRFSAIVRSPGGDWSDPAVGSVVRVTGIIEGLPQLEESMLGREAKSFRLLLRSAGDLVIVTRGPWWTGARLLTTVGAVGLLSIAGLGWAVTLRRRNRQLASEVEARMLAEEALQTVNTGLEKRVEERSSQLAQEIQARQQAKHEMEVLSRERHRLAAELHDSLAQVLTSAAFQLQALKTNLDRAETRDRHMDLTAKLLLRARQEARNSIWDLRSSVLDDLGLAGALRETVEEILANTAIEAEFQIEVPRKRFSPLLEHHLHRLAQEAVTNAARHARASRVFISLEHLPELVRLVIRDDGCGFNPSAAPSPADGHFGLVGMSERVSRLDGRLEIQSRPGEGTTIMIDLPSDDSTRY